MNTKPDFTKAPEGATHYAIDGLGYTVWFRDIVEGESYKVCGRFCPFWVRGEGFPALKYELIPLKEWNGPEDGLPPVGTVCEYLTATGFWVKSSVVYIGKSYGTDHAVMQSENEIYLCNDINLLRPIKTKEQRELDRLQADISEAFETDATLSEFLHTKGYRKMEDK